MLQWDDGFVDEGNDIYSELENPQAPSPLPDPAICSIPPLTSCDKPTNPANTAQDDNNMTLSLIEEEVTLYQLNQNYLIVLQYPYCSFCSFQSGLIKPQGAN